MNEPEQKRLPYFPCKVNELAAALHTLSNDVAGCYMRLLCWMWENGKDRCSIVNSEPLLLRAFGCNKRTLKKCLTELTDSTHPVLKTEGPFLVSQGLRATHTRVKAKQSAGRKGGNASANAKQTLTKEGSKDVHLKLKPKLKPKAESVLRGEPAGDRGQSEPVAVGEIVADKEIVEIDNWMSEHMALSERAYMLEPGNSEWTQHDWQRLIGSVRECTGSDDWFEARLNEVRDRTTGNWQGKYDKPIEGNPAAWLNSQCQAMLKGEWK